MSYRWSDLEVKAGDVVSLRRTPTILTEMLKDRPDSWLDAHHEESCLSPRETLGHLIYSETYNWIPRIRHIVTIGDAEPFAALTIEGGDESLTIGEQLETFSRLRAENVQALEELNLSEADLGKTAIHPKLGVVTLDQQISTWVTHDLYHCGQIFKAFASGFQPYIGPWQAFLNLPHFN